jgi:hypothetical protein
VLACFAQAPFMKQAVEAFAAKSLGRRPLTVVSDGLWCFTAAEAAGMHERVATGGGKASAKPPQFQPANTVPSNLKTAMAGTYDAVKFAPYAQRHFAEMQYRFKRSLRSEIDPAALMHAAAATAPNRATPSA